MKSKLIMFVALVLMAAGCTSRTYVDRYPRYGHHHERYDRDRYDHRYDRDRW